LASNTRKLLAPRDTQEIGHIAGIPQKTSGLLVLLIMGFLAVFEVKTTSQKIFLRNFHFSIDSYYGP
jgi:hypothetical protein